MVRIFIRPYALIATAAIFIPGCTTSIPGLEEWADQNIGRPITELRELDKRPGSYASRVHWVEKTYSLNNGNRVYVHPDRVGCEIHFEVGMDGNVVSYTPVGEGCGR